MFFLKNKMLNLKFRINKQKNRIILRFNLIKGKIKERPRILPPSQYLNKNKSLFIKLCRIR